MESPTSSTFTGGPPFAVTPGTDEVVVLVAVDPVGGGGGSAVPAPAPADNPVVAANTATRTAPMPAGTTSHARHWLTKVPIRIGRSMRWKETTETPKVDEARAPRTARSPGGPFAGR